jgi:hypothetical protein
MLRGEVTPMNKTEAKSILADFLEPYRQLSYEELASRVDSVETDEVRGDSGVTYSLEAVIVWDAETGGVIRVIGHIDDGGWRAFCPMTDDFLLGPDGRFIGE